jgi:dCMP deaminase
MTTNQSSPMSTNQSSPMITDNLSTNTTSISESASNSSLDLKEDTKSHIKAISRTDLKIRLSNGSEVVMRRSKAIKYYKLTQYMANLFSKDPSTKVGALFMYPGTLHILSMGYNGMPRNIDESKAERWERTLKYKMVEHAERNAIYNAAHSGVSLRDSICVASLCPCSDCSRGLIQSGCKMLITRDINDVQGCGCSPDVIKRWSPEWDISISMMKEAGIEIMFLSGNEIDSIGSIGSNDQKNLMTFDSREPLAE